MSLVSMVSRRLQGRRVAGDGDLLPAKLGRCSASGPELCLLVSRANAFGGNHLHHFV